MERRGQQATVLQRDPRLCVDGCVSTAALLWGHAQADWPCTPGLSWGREDASERHTGVLGPPSAAKGRGPSEPTSSLKVTGDQSQ